MKGAAKVVDVVSPRFAIVAVETRNIRVNCNPSELDTGLALGDKLRGVPHKVGIPRRKHGMLYRLRSLTPVRDDVGIGLPKIGFASHCLALAHSHHRLEVRLPRPAVRRFVSVKGKRGAFRPPAPLRIL